MTESPEAVIRRALELFGKPREEIESEFRELLDPAVEWVNPPEAIEGGIRSGFDGWMTAVDNIRTGLGTDATYDVDSFVVRGEQVLVGGFMQTGGTSSGAEAGMRTYAVWTVVDGRIKRFEWSLDAEAAQRRFEQLAGPD